MSILHVCRGVPRRAVSYRAFWFLKADDLTSCGRFSHDDDPRRPAASWRLFPEMNTAIKLKNSQPQGSPTTIVNNERGLPTLASDVDSADSKQFQIRSSFRSPSQESRNLRVSFVTTGLSDGILGSNTFRVPSDLEFYRDPLEREHRLLAMIKQRKKSAYGACIFSCCLSLLALIYMSKALKEVDNARYDEAEKLLHKSGIVIILSAVTGIVSIVTVFSIAIVITFAE